MRGRKRQRKKTAQRTFRGEYVVLTVRRWKYVRQAPIFLKVLEHRLRTTPGGPIYALGLPEALRKLHVCNADGWTCGNGSHCSPVFSWPRTED
jgi:hypothetical protein